MSPAVDKIVLLVEQFHFEHEILGNMMVEGGTGWLVKLGKVYSV